jgi:hypothetical protein
LCQTGKNQTLKGKIYLENPKERKLEAKSIDIYIINKEYIPSHKLNLPSKKSQTLSSSQ